MTRRTLAVALAMLIGHAPAAAAATYDREPRPSRSVAAARAAAVIPASMARFAECVSERESGGSYTARNASGSSAQGRWQFLDRQWRHGLSFMVRDRLVRFGMPRPEARKIREWLAAHEIAAWPGPYQDAGFVEVMSRGGAHHWALAGSSCERFR